MAVSDQPARAAMIDAAEWLLAERGIDAVSLRDVQAAAGQRNKSAAQYHFGSRDGLIDAIIATRMAPIDLARRRRLDDLEGSGVNPTTGDYVRALVEPLADATVRRRRSWYARFLARSYTDPVWAGAVDDSGHGTALVSWRHRLDEHLADAIPELPASLRQARINRAISTAILAIAACEGRRSTAAQRDARISDLIDSITAALDAGVSAATLDLLDGAINLDDRSDDVDAVESAQTQARNSRRRVRSSREIRSAAANDLGGGHPAAQTRSGDPGSAAT
jgi:AcrR family transcriptional regulator